MQLSETPSIHQYQALEGGRWGWPSAVRKPGEENFILCHRCGAKVWLHGAHWVAEVCPNCLQTFRWGSGADYNIYPDCGYFTPEGQKRIRANIAKNGGRYVPEF